MFKDNPIQIVIMLSRVTAITSRITMNVLNTRFKMLVERDKIYKDGRFFLQVEYEAICTRTGIPSMWKGRKWYLSEHMTDDEIVKTSWCALESAVKHECMEGFKIDGKVLFNPHTNYEALLSISDKEIRRS